VQAVDRGLQLLEMMKARGVETDIGMQFTCFTGTKIHILTQKARVSDLQRPYRRVYLLYWYKSTHTDAEGAP
jgi:hypothetical protein